jgi:hypothetical protein
MKEMVFVKGDDRNEPGSLLMNLVGGATECDGSAQLR